MPPKEVKSVRERFGALRLVLPLFRQVWRTSPPLTLAVLAVRLVRAVLPVVTLYIGKLIIDEIVAAAALPSKPVGFEAWVDSGLLDRAMLLLGAELALAIVSDLIGRVGSLLEGMLGGQFGIATSVRIMEHAATLDLEQFEDSEMQDRLERARMQAGSGLGVLGMVLGQLQNLITLLSFAAGLAVYAPWLIFLLLLALIPAFVGESYFNAREYALQFSRATERRLLDYLRGTAASVETAKEVKIFALNAFLIERFRTLSHGFYLATRALAARRARWMGALTAIGTVGYYAAYGYIAWRTLVGEFSIGDLTFLSGSFRRLSGLLEGLLVGFSQAASQALYLDDLFSFFTVRSAIASPANPRPMPERITDGFRFEGVGFRYPGSEKWAVRDLSFELRAGETLALVGENGAGKTTLVKLLARLYDPDEGRILLDGHDLREYDLDALRADIGVIFQDFVRYHMTAAENIAVGRIEARDDRARIEAAASRSLADPVIRALPAGYDQLIGKRFRRGIELSGGEWQKVAIARAYMRQAGLLILDEPTAALDARAEYEVFLRFKELSAGRTSVLISHRFSSVRMADRILVLVDGSVESAGTHEELIAQGGRYAELFELQAAGYR